MFRSAVVRASLAARSAIRPAASTTSTAARRIVVASPKTSATSSLIAPRALAWSGGVRCYASGGGLNKEEVEGRVKALLEGFDKVGFILRLLFIRSSIPCCSVGRSPTLGAF